MHGLSRASQVAGFALGPLALGVAYDIWGNYQGALVYLAVAALGSFVLVLLARKPVRRDLPPYLNWNLE